MSGRAAEKGPTVIVTGSPDAPAFKRRPGLLAIAVVVYAIWMTLLVVWALQLHHAK